MVIQPGGTLFRAPVARRSTSAAPAPLDQLAPASPGLALARPETIDSVASKLEQQWADEMPNPKATTGIIVERDWRPSGPHDPILLIAEGIKAAQGRPRLLYLGRNTPAVQMGKINCLAIPGGRDVTPSRYGKELGPAMDPKEPDAAFDDFTIACIKIAYENGMPLLGHCRGEQIMNVAAGGTLTQDIPTEFHSPPGFGSRYGTKIDHRPDAARNSESLWEKPSHLIYVEPGTRLHEIVGDCLEQVNSIHHQCIENLATMFVPVCFALDGVVEGIQRKDMPWQNGYQFHPEGMRKFDEKFQKLYDNLINDGARFAAGTLF